MYFASALVGSMVAIKFLNEDNNYDDVKTEVDYMKNLNHPNIVKCIGFKEDGLQVKDDGKEIPVAYIVMELVEFGELYGYVANKALRPEICRFYFKQILEVLKYLHEQGVVHRDLKLDNIMLDKSYNVKIIDWGFAAPVQGRDGKGFLHLPRGTSGF